MVWKKVRPILLVALSVSSLACPIPMTRELSVQATIDGGSVLLQGHLRDLLLVDDDPIRGFRQLGNILTPKRAATALRVAEIERASRYVFQERDGGLDLEVDLPLSRQEWDERIRACEADKGKCGWLAGTRGDAGYSFRDLEGYVREACPAHPARPACRFALKERESADRFPSALSIYRKYGTEPGALDLLAWMDRVDQAFNEWKVARSAEVVSSRPSGISPGLKEVAEAYLLRKRLKLLTDARDNRKHCKPDDPLRTSFNEDKCGFRLPNSGPPKPDPPLFSRPLGKSLTKRIGETVSRVSAAPDSSAMEFRALCRGASGEVRSLCRMLGVQR